MNPEKRKASEVPKEQRRKKPKDMPRRPLSAYNLYFRAEREKIIDKYERGEKIPDFVVPPPPHGNDPKKIKAHNAVVFQAVARTIANRWKNTGAAKKSKFEQQAAVEMKKYRSRMEEYEQHMIRNSTITKRNEERQTQKETSTYVSSTAAAKATQDDAAASFSPRDQLGFQPSTETSTLSVTGRVGIDLGMLGTQQGAQATLLGSNALTSDISSLPGLVGNNALVSDISSLAQRDTLSSLRTFGGLAQHASALNLPQASPTNTPGLVVQSGFGSNAQNTQQPNQNYLLRLHQQLRLEQELQQLAVLRRMQQQAGFPLQQQQLLLALGESPSAGPTVASQGRAGGDHLQGSFCSLTVDELQFLRSQALMGQALPQQRNQILERLLMESIGADPSRSSSMGDSNSCPKRTDHK